MENYNVISNGLWRDSGLGQVSANGSTPFEQLQDEHRIVYNPFPIEDVQRALDSLRETGVQWIDPEEANTEQRRFRMVTNGAGYEQFEQAVRERLEDLLDRNRVELGTSAQSVLPINYGSVQTHESARIDFIDFSEEEPVVGTYVAGIDPYIPEVTGIAIGTRTYIETPRQFRTEEEIINYLDQISSNDI